ncbi:MAG TPA: hypothetical protein VFR36_02405 [Sphingomicrobium sp.]|nr:hypothetical protein [Sphingomicrobium sp.]
MLSLIAAAALAAPSPIYHYIRSNRDGSEPEHVVQYRPTRTTVSVYKWVEKCKTAAYVTAVMSDDLLDARFFVAGKVARDGSQARFGTLALDPRLMTLSADVAPPGGPRIQVKHMLRARPFLLYDFDFADLNSFLQEHRPKSDFSFALPVIWPADDAVFRDLGMLRARYAGPEERLGRQVVRYDLRVDGPTASTGTLWADAAQGFIVEADLGLPNHMEYKDFRLRLEKLEAGSQSAWDALTKSHYAGCPAT